MLSSWYTPAELGKRSGLFYASGMAVGVFPSFMVKWARSDFALIQGGLFSGFLQTAGELSLFLRFRRK